jgi:zinc protease
MTAAKTERPMGEGGPVRITSNGAPTVIVASVPGAPAVAVQAWIRAGASDESEHEHGAAHLLEHMLFRAGRRGVDLARTVERAGGQVNAYTTHDLTVVHLTVPPAHLDESLHALGAAILAPALDPDELERERQVVLEEIAEREDDPGRVLSQAMFRAAYGDHPYGRSVVGTRAEVAALGADLLAGFHARTYRPERISVIVTGAVTPADVTALAGPAWRTAAPPPRPSPPRRSVKAPLARGDARRVGGRLRIVALEREINEGHVELAFLIPPMGDARVPALDVAAAILGQGRASRLETEVRRRARLVDDASASTWTPREPGLFLVSASIPPGDPEPALTALLDQIFELGTSGPSDEELRRARAALEAGGVMQRETAEGLATKLGWYETVAGGIEAERRYLAAVAAIDAEAVRLAVADGLTTSQLTLAVLVPKRPGAQSSGQVAKSAGGASGAGLPARLERLALAREAGAKARRSAAPVGVATSADLVHETLESGVRLLIKREAGVPLVALRAVWSGGQLEEEPSTAGYAKLLSRVLVRGTRRRSGDQLAADLAAVGGAVNGFSGKSSLGVRVDVLARDVEAGLGALAECVREPAFGDGEIGLAAHELDAGRRARPDDPAAVAYRGLEERLYPGHPLGLDPLGSSGSLAGLDGQTLRSYYEAHYPLATLTVVVVGDVEPARVRSQVIRLFGQGGGNTAPRGGAQAKSPAPSVAPGAAAAGVRAPVGPREVFESAPLTQAHVVVGFPGVTVADADRHALDVIAIVLAGQGGRLFHELRERRGLAYSVGAFSQEGLAPGYFSIYMAVPPAARDEALGLVRAELERLKREPIPADELERARRVLAASRALALESRASRATAFALAESYGLGWDAPLLAVDAAQKVDAAAIQRVAGARFTWAEAVIVSVMPLELTPGASVRARGKVMKAPRPDAKAKPPRAPAPPRAPVSPPKPSAVAPMPRPPRRKKNRR